MKRSAAEKDLDDHPIVGTAGITATITAMDSASPDNSIPEEQQLLKLNPDVRVGVMLLHGLTGVPSEMKYIARHLQRLGCIVDTPLLAGHGAGHEELLATGWKDWHQGAQESLAQFSEKCDIVITSGLSMGAAISALLAVDNPKVAGIVPMSTTIKYDGRAAGAHLDFLLPLVDLIPILGKKIYWIEKPPYGLKDRRLQQLITRQIELSEKGGGTESGTFRTYVKSFRQMQHMNRHLRKHAHKIKCPALILHAHEDSWTTPWNAEELHRWLGSEEKEIQYLHGCDHVMTLDVKKNEVSKHIGQFAAKLSWNLVQPKRAVAPLT